MDPPAIRLFDVSIVSSGFGSRVYLRCPKTGRMFEEMRVWQGEIFSRPELQSRLSAAELRQLRPAKVRARLKGADGRGPSRRVRRQQLETWLEEREAAASLSGQPLDPRLEALQLACTRSGREIRALRDEADGDPTLYQPIDAHASEPRMLRTMLSDLEAVTAEDCEPTGELQSVHMGWEGLPSFTSNDFLAACATEKGKPFVRAIGDAAARAAFVGYAGRRRPPILCLRVQGSEHRQYVRVLSRRGRREALFLCPLNGDPCHTLWLRDGRFGGWRAQKVV